MSCFFLPSVRFYMLSEPPWDLQMLFKDWRTSCFRRFSGKLRFHRKEEFAGNALQSDGIQRDSPPLRLEKPTGEDRYGLKQTRDK